ncbi:MAG TPA: DUF4442 domain-containing protein [Pseudobdellovibrionaceae bacterium]|nr:DUF4442 domain-containing protein [Pseudobdellovibrionaceae bacterium]
MNSQWLTTLKSKGEEVKTLIEMSLVGQAHLIKKRIEESLNQRGIKLTPQDLTSLIEEISPELSQKLLSGVFNVMRPFSKGMGLRISQLTNDHIEMVLPQSIHNEDENKNIHSGAVLTAAVECVKILWERHAPMEGFKIHVKKMDLENLAVSLGNLRVKYQLLESERETVLSQLRLERKSKVHGLVQIYNEQDQRVFDVNLELEFEFTPQLTEPS